MAVAGSSSVVPDVRQLGKRDVKALTEYMVSVKTDAPGMYDVWAEDGRNRYRVDVRSGACDCPDMEYHDPDDGCKHVRRVRLRTGRDTIPASVTRDAIDDNLLDHVDDA